MGFWAAGDTVYTVFTLTDADGAASDADSLPTAAVYLNGVANGASVTVTDLGTGLYSATWTNPGANGNTVSVVASFTMDGVASHATIWESRLSAQPYSGTPPSANDIAAAVDAPTASEIADAVSADLDIPTAQENAEAVIAAYVALDIESNADGSQQVIKDGNGNTLDTYSGS